MPRLKFALIAVGLAALAALPIFAPALLGFRLIGESGIIHIYFFNAERQLLLLGQIPGWLPNFMSGYPISLTLDGFLNPLFLLVLKSVPAIPAYNAITYVFFVINLLSAYALARKLKLGKPASIVAALTYAFSGIIIRWTEFVVFTVLYPVLPLSFLACLNIKEGKRAWWWALVVMLAYGWIGGFAELIVYDLFALAPFCLVLLFSDERFAKSAWQSDPWKTALAFLKEGFLKYFLPVALSLIIVLPWLVSVLAYITVSNRAHGMPPMNGYDSMPLTISYVIHMLLPRLNVPYGNNIPFLRLADDIDLYIGTVPLFLLLTLPFTWKSRKQPYRWFFVGLLAFGITMAIDSPVYDALHRLPILNFFRWHFKWTFLSTFSAGMLAGYAVELLPAFRDHRYARLTTKILWALFGIGAAAALGITVFAGRIERLITTYGTAHYQAVASSAGFVAQRSADYYAWIVGMMAHGLVTGFSFRDPWTAASIALWAVGLAAFTMIVFRPSALGRYANLTLIGATFLGCAAVWPGLLTPLPASFLSTEPETVRFLHAANAYRGVPVTTETASKNIPYRMFTYTPDQMYADAQDTYRISLTGTDAIRTVGREFLGLNLHMWYDIDGADDHEPLASERIIAMRNEAIGRATTGTYAYADEIARFSSNGSARLLGDMNVKYVLTIAELGAPWKLVNTSRASERDIPVYVYENPLFLPRWRFADRVVFADPEQGSNAPASVLARVEAAPAATVIERRDPGDGLAAATATSTDTLTLVEYTAGRLVLASNTAGARWVVFSETTSPFWRATIDGVETPIRHADVAFQAILVPPGAHTVTFSYAGFLDRTRMSVGMLVRP